MKFDIWGADDIEQEIYFLILAASEKYDPSKIDNDYIFYYNFVRNRLNTFKRDNYHHNTYKKLIKDAITLECDPIEEIDLFIETYKDEIDGRMSAELREDYLKFKEGVKIPYRNKVILIDYIKSIVESINNGEAE